MPCLGHLFKIYLKSNSKFGIIRTCLPAGKHKPPVGDRYSGEPESLSSNVLVGDLVSADARQKAFYGNKAKQDKIMNIVTKIRVNSWSNSLCALIPLWICHFSSTNVEDSLQIDLFIQNKAKVKYPQINVNSLITSIYVKVTLGEIRKTNPIKPNLQKAKMDVNLYLIEDYSKKDDFVVRINKPNFRNGPK